MASTTRLDLQFTGQGPERVLSLTTDNVESVFRTVGLRSRGGRGRTFGAWLKIPDDLWESPSSAAHWWMKNSSNRTWRYIIYWIDCVGETGVADELIPYAEPPSDQSMTPEIVIPIFEELEKWDSTGGLHIGIHPIVPPSRADIIRKTQTQQEQKRKAAEYYVNIYPDASWGLLAELLYKAYEERAINIFKAQLPIPKDPTLSLVTLMRETAGIILHDTAGHSGKYTLQMPAHKYNDLVKYYGTKDEAKLLLFTEFLSKHPYPRWELVVDLLEELEYFGKARSGLAQELKEKYLTTSHESHHTQLAPADVFFDTPTIKSTVSYDHHQYDDESPHICFLGEEQQLALDSKGGHFAFSDLGISLEVPPNAVPTGESITLCSRPCLDGPFKYPEGYEPLSAVYLITSKGSFQKEVELKMKHYGRLETEEQADQMCFFSAKRTQVLVRGKEVYDFRPIEDGNFAVNTGVGTLKLKHFCYITCGTKKSTEKQNCVLFSKSKGITRNQYAALSVSLDNDVYIKNFFKIINKDREMEFPHNEKVSFLENIATVILPPAPDGWSIVPSCKSCQFEQEVVNDPKSKGAITYPPRYIFTIISTEEATHCIYDFHLEGMSRQLIFPFPLQPAKKELVSRGKLKLDVREMVNALNTVQFAAADWDKLGLQLGVEQHKLKTIRADRNDCNTKLSSMLDLWIQSDVTASWERLASALGQTPSYGVATEAKFRSTVGLPDSLSGQGTVMRKRNLYYGRDGPVEFSHSHPPLHAPSPVNTAAHKTGLTLTQCFIFIIIVLVTLLTLLFVYIRVCDKLMEQ